MRVLNNCLGKMRLIKIHNMSKCTPITAKAKQSPFKANEALIKGAAYAYGSDKGEDKQVTETTKSSYQGKKMSDAEWNALTPEQRRRMNANVGANEQGEIVTETTKTVPGDDLNYSAKLKTAVKGDVFTPQERRQESRDTKKSYRDEKRARLKAARAKNRLEDAESKGNSKRTARLKIKSDIATKKAEDFTAASKRGSLSKQSGLAPGAGKAYLYDRDVSLGERTETQQLEQARQEALKRSGFPMRSGFKMKGYGKNK